MFSNLRSRSFQSCSSLLCISPLFKAKHFPTKPLLRTAAFLPKILHKSVILDKSHHRLIYKFPYISLLGAFMRSKISVPAAAFSLSPVLYFLDKTHVSSLILLLSGGLYYAIGLLMSKFTVNVVGKIYVNKEGDITEVIMSSVDETGRRIDRIHKLEDLINIDYPNKFSQSLGFIAIAIENSSFYYKINLTNCQIVDESACDYVFGSLWRGIKNYTSESKNKENLDSTDKKLPEK